MGYVGCIDLGRVQNTFILVLPHGITIAVDSLLNSPAEGSLKFMNYLLDSIIMYRLPLPLSKISVSLGFNDAFHCAGVRLDLSSGGGDGGSVGGGDDSFFVLVLESLLFPVSILALVWK